MKLSEDVRDVLGGLAITIAGILALIFGVILLLHAVPAFDNWLSRKRGVQSFEEARIESHELYRMEKLKKLQAKAEAPSAE